MIFENLIDKLFNIKEKRKFKEFPELEIFDEYYEKYYKTIDIIKQPWSQGMNYKIHNKKEKSHLIVRHFYYLNNKMLEHNITKFEEVKINYVKECKKHFKIEEN